MAHGSLPAAERTTMMLPSLTFGPGSIGIELEAVHECRQFGRTGARVVSVTGPALQAGVAVGSVIEGVDGVVTGVMKFYDVSLSLQR